MMAELTFRTARSFAAFRHCLGLLPLLPDFPAADGEYPSITGTGVASTRTARCDATPVVMQREFRKPT